MDSSLAKINSYFNYRHIKFNLELKPQTTTSATRSWRSHRENYQISMRNYDQYEELMLTKTDFPKIPDKLMLRKVSMFQENLCEHFDTLENRNSDLLDQLSVYIKVWKLSKESVCTSILGDSLQIIMEQESTVEAFLSNDTLAYCYLSKIDFHFVFSGLGHIDPSVLLERAKLRIRSIIEQSGQTLNSSVSKSMNLPKGMNANSHTDSLFERPVAPPPNQINEAVGIEIDYFKKFDSLKDFNRIQFWQNYKNELTVLFDVYLHLRSIPASNSSVERSFSIAGRIFDDLKNSTSDASIEAQVTICIEKTLNRFALFVLFFAVYLLFDSLTENVYISQICFIL